MGNLAIAVEHLGKRYRIGHAAKCPENFREAVRSFVGAPFQYLRSRLRPPSEDELIWALKDVSFEVNHGEVLGIIGRNGAGKSTLLKILSRITEPTEGQAQVYGRVGSLLEVGTGFHQELTGRENIYLNGAILGMRRAEIDRRFDAIVDFSGVEKFLDTPVKRYSSGMYVRLAFAVAAHLEPEILLVDEVLAVGDVEFQKKCLGKMGDVAKEGRTVLFVSHNMATISGLCNRVVVLSKGQLLIDSYPKDAIKQYLSETLELETLSTQDFGKRKGNRCFRFTRIEMLDANTRKPLKVIQNGEAIIIRAEYVVNNPDFINRNLGIGFPFRDLYHHFKFAVNSEAVGFKLFVSEKGVVECLIPKFPLYAGEYYCSLCARIDDVDVDFVEQAIFVKVTDGDFYGTGGKLPARGLAGVFVPYQWLK